MKNSEIAQLRSTIKLLSSQNPPKQEKQMYNFNFTVGRSSSIFKIVACVTMLMYILLFSSNPLSEPQKTAFYFEPIVTEISRSETKHTYISAKEKYRGKSNITHIYQKSSDNICININGYLTSFCPIESNQ